MVFLAKTKDGKGAVYLSRDEQMEKYLALNCNIYGEDENTEKLTLIATPEDGFLVERPVFPATHTMSLVKEA